MVRLLSVGTCRLQIPLRQMQRRFAFELKNKGASYGFVHSSGEALQQLQWAHGERRVPPELWRFLSEEPYRSPSDWKEPDAAVLEISSLKELLFDGFSLQLHRLKLILYDAPDLLQVLLLLPRRHNLIERRAVLAHHPRYPEQPETVREVLAHATVESTSREALTTHLSEILDRLPRRRLVVTHCDALDAHGAPLAGRRRVIAETIAAAKDLGERWHDPSESIVKVGYDQGWAEGGRDTGHYTPTFAERVGVEICTALGLRDGDAAGEAYSESALAAHSFAELKLFATEAITAKNFSRALKVADAMARQKPDSAMTFQYRARALTGVGRYAEAMDEWDSYFATNGPDIRKHFEALRAAMAANDQAKMRGYAREILNLSKKQRDALPRFQKLVKEALQNGDWRDVALLSLLVLEARPDLARRRPAEPTPIRVAARARSA